ncbi:MAG: hypothetical protein GXO43_05840 [Crenarchaeota archaeon]|nr:hypothetical protein [Thermoproteota archaeon]
MTTIFKPADKKLPYQYEAEFNSKTQIKTRYGYGLRFLELWFPKNMDLETVKYYVAYIGNYLAKHGIDSYASIYVPNKYGFRRVLFSLNWPKGVRGLNKIVYDILRKLKEKGVKGEFTAVDYHSWSGQKVLYSTW